jgi:hypothetical protein
MTWEQDKARYRQSALEAHRERIRMGDDPELSRAELEGDLWADSYADRAEAHYESLHAEHAAAAAETEPEAEVLFSAVAEAEIDEWPF